MRPLIAAITLLAAVPAFADREVSHRTHAVAPVAGVRLLTIDVPAGEVTIRNGASDRITIDGDVRLRHDTRRTQEMQEIINDVDLAIGVEGDHATIYRTFGPNAGSWRARHMTEFETIIEVPAGLEVDVETHFGELRIEGSFARLDVDLKAGEVTLRTPKAGVRSLDASVTVGEVHTNLGDRILSREGVFPGHTRYQGSGRADVNVHVTAGEVRITLTP